VYICVYIQLHRCPYVCIYKFSLIYYDSVAHVIMEDHKQDWLCKEEICVRTTTVRGREAQTGV